jgi:hypothetical protein
MNRLPEQLPLFNVEQGGITYAASMRSWHFKKEELNISIWHHPEESLVTSQID